MTTNVASLAAILSDNAPGAAIAADPVKSMLDTLEASAVAMGVAMGAAESAAAMAAKDWGCSYLNLVKVHGQDGDSLAERTRAALGWKDLKGEAGSVIKRRFNTWRSNVGVLSGRWAEVTPEEQTDLLGGTRSFITVYKRLIEADKAEKARKAAEEKAAEKAAETAPNKPEATGPAPAPAFDVVTAIDAFKAYIATMSADDANAHADAFEGLATAWDARVNELTAAPAAAAA